MPNRLAAFIVPEYTVDKAFEITADGQLTLALAVRGLSVVIASPYSLETGDVMRPNINIDGTQVGFDYDQVDPADIVVVRDHIAAPGEGYTGSKPALNSDRAKTEADKFEKERAAGVAKLGSRHMHFPQGIEARGLRSDRDRLAKSPGEPELQAYIVRNGGTTTISPLAVTGNNELVDIILPADIDRLVRDRTDNICRRIGGLAGTNTLLGVVAFAQSEQGGIHVVGTDFGAPLMPNSVDSPHAAAMIRTAVADTLMLMSHADQND